MSSTLLSFKTDDRTKQEIKDFAAELGMPMTTFVNVVVRQALRDRRVVLGTGLEPTLYLKDLIREAEADHRAGKNITHVTSRAELKRYLDTI